MNIWELKTDSPDVYAPLVASDEQARSRIFVFDGTAREWKRRPAVDVFKEGKKKDQLPTGDVSLMLAGSIVLNQKALAALGVFLGQFGQFLEAKVDGAAEYFYNVTNVVDCIDLEASVRRSSGSIVKEAFRPEALPGGPAVFKDPRTVRNRLYVNQEGKAIIEARIAAADLTGLEIADLGES